MKQIALIITTAILLSSTAFAGSITTNPNSGQSDEVVSTVVSSFKITKFRVLAKTALETFSIEMNSYADASSLAADLKKDTTTYCKMKTNLRTEAISECKFVRIGFND